jgi:hypothetical protein
MDFIRQLLVDAPAHMSKNAVLVLEIGNEREHFEAAFPHLEAVWLETSAGEDQVLLVTREALSPLLPAAEARRAGRVTAFVSPARKICAPPLHRFAGRCPRGG